MKSIGIIGGSGYIGGYLLHHLSADFKVTSLQRNIHTIMPRSAGITIADLSLNDQTFDIIINTSYNLGKDIEMVYKQNREVLDFIQKASHSQTRIIHLSSLAVFGYGLDKPVIPQPVSLQNDYTYVQSKVHMEQLLLQAIPHEQLSIIRLGNVWGPANNSWTQPVADALQWGLPVLSPQNSFSNITSVAHITDYITFVINQNQHLLFHHLAEFSSVTWRQIIEELSRYLKVTPVAISDIPFYPAKIIEDVEYAILQSPVNALKQLRDGRFTSHYFPHTFFTQLRSFFHAPRKQPQVLPKSSYHADPAFYWILTCTKEFKTITLPGWKPPYTWATIMKDIKEWLGQSGFINEI